MEFGIEKICHANNEKQKKTNNGRNRTASSTKNQNAWRKGKLQVLWNIRSGLYPTIRDERSNKKRVPQKYKKTSRNHALNAKITSKE